MNWTIVGLVAVTVVAVAALLSDPYKSREGRGDGRDWLDGEFGGGDGGGD